MPRSRGRGKYGQTHYNPYATIISPKQRQAKFGKRGKPIKGTTHRITTQSPYMGSVITPENRNQYERDQANAFVERYVANIEKERNDIKNQDDKSEDEINMEVAEFNSKQTSERELMMTAVRFARFQSTKEKKHYAAWLKGKSHFKFKERTFPVLTERFLRQSKSIKEIIKVEEDGSNGKTDGLGYAAGKALAGLSSNSEGRDDKTV
jgi:hypothetical protein